MSVLLGLLIVIGGTWGFAKIADVVFEGQSTRFDESILRAMRRADDPAIPIGPPWLHEIGRDVTALGGTAILTLVIAAVAGFLLLRRMYGSMWLVLGATTTGLAVSLVLKRAFARPRPSVVPHLAEATTSSFPSGHSMLAAVVYLTLGILLARCVRQRSLKAYFLVVALVLTLLVGISRVYLGVHYPTDVLAGWSLGLAWGMMCEILARLLRRRGALEAEPLESE